MKERLRSIFLCMVLELGALAGVPMPPEKIRAALHALNEPQLAHVLPAEDDDGSDPPY